MGGRKIGTFLLGFLVGALSIYYLLWRTGGLLPGHPLALTTKELARQVPATPPPLSRIPLPTPTASLQLFGATSSTLFFSPPTTPAQLPTLSLGDFSLSGEKLVMPVEGTRHSDLRDSFAEVRGTHRHEAIDIPAPRGTPVLAAVDGTIAKLFTSEQGGLTIYEFDRGAVYCYYYAHLDRYAEGLHEGQAVLRGERIGHVGTTGDAPKDAPHLHFTIFRLRPEKRWWEGVAVDPYPPLLAAALKE